MSEKKKDEDKQKPTVKILGKVLKKPEGEKKEES